MKEKRCCLPSCEQASREAPTWRAAGRDRSPGRTGSVGGEAAGCQGEALARPAARSCGRSNMERSLPSRGSGKWPQGVRNSSRLLSMRSLKLNERFPGSSALRGERGVERGNIILLEEEKWERIN